MMSQTVIAMSLLRAPVVPDVKKIVAKLKAPKGKRYAVAALDSTDQTATFRLDGDLVTITDMGSPVPWSDLEGLCTKNWRWPTADKECRSARSHHIVTLSTNDSDPFRARLRLTDVVAADVAASGAIGVYWGEAPVVNSADIFAKMSHQADPEYLPLHLWLTFDVVPVADGRWFFATQGMKAFGFMEIELERTTSDPVKTVGDIFNVAHYLLDNGAVLEDGNTFGTSAKQKIRIHHVVSRRDKGQLVYRLSDE
jgi:hypothetical protein